MTLHVFNPEHDMALAAGTPNYTPPAHIRSMAAQLAWLPRLWAPEGDAVGHADDVSLVDNVEPWGWDAALRQQLLRMGVDISVLPSVEWLARVRELSSRRTAVLALREFRSSGVGRLTGESHWCESMDDVDVFRGGRFVLKSPWSSSGKGVQFVNGCLSAQQRLWCERVLRQQGGMAVEVFCDRRSDAALEYFVSPDDVCCLGLSVFNSSPTGAYTGNVLSSHSEKLSLLGLDSRRLDEIVRLHSVFLRRHIAPYYHGPLGIDILVCPDGSINPCIEINLRRTMGHVALALEQRGRRGLFLVTCKAGKWTAE